jgi:hypothetical protein
MLFGGKIGLPELLILLVLFLVFAGVIAATVLAWWRIFTRAGRPGILALLMLIPFARVPLLMWFAYTDWPNQKLPTLNT